MNCEVESKELEETEEPEEVGTESVENCRIEINIRRREQNVAGAFNAGCRPRLRLRVQVVDVVVAVVGVDVDGIKSVERQWRRHREN